MGCSCLISKKTLNFPQKSAYTIKSTLQNKRNYFSHLAKVCILNIIDYLPYPDLVTLIGVNK